MQQAEVDEWFGSYLVEFEALGRGEADPRRVLQFWGSPMVMTSDSACLVLTEQEQVLTAMRDQIDGLRAVGYHHSVEVDASTTVLNRHSVQHRGRMIRYRADGSEIAQLVVTYLITDAGSGPRISAIAVHPATP